MRYPMLSSHIHSEAQPPSTFADSFAEKRFPAITFAPGAKFCIFFPESPIGLPPDVAKGITVFPLKS